MRARALRACMNVHVHFRAHAHLLLGVLDHPLLLGLEDHALLLLLAHQKGIGLVELGAQLLLLLALHLAHRPLLLQVGHRHRLHKLALAPADEHARSACLRRSRHEMHARGRAQTCECAVCMRMRVRTYLCTWTFLRIHAGVTEFSRRRSRAQVGVGAKTLVSYAMRVLEKGVFDGDAAERPKRGPS
eukprot:6184281-Pleurochrysis_carterae.AAC.3